MTAMVIRRFFAAMAMTAVPFVLSACGEDKEKQAEIERLTAELESLDESLSNSKRDYKRVSKQNDERRDALGEERGKVRTLESKLVAAERELRRFRAREEREKERAAAKRKEPSRLEKRKIAKEQASEKLGTLVDIKGDRSKGSGFLVEDDGKVWVYFAARILAGNSKLEVTRSGGERLEKFGAFEVAADADLARLEVLEAPEEKLVLSEPSELVSGTPLLGVSEGGDLVEGRSYEAAPTQLKADSRIGECPVGTPVFHGESGALLGFVSDPPEADRDLWEGMNSRSRPRRFVGRLDRKIEWQAMPIATFLSEARQIADADRLTRVVYAFAALRPSADGLDLNANMEGGQSASKIFDENGVLSAVKSLFELKGWIEEKADRSSEADVQRRIDKVFSQIAQTSGSQTRKFKGQQFSPFHQAAAKQSLEWRREAEESLAETIKKMKE